MFSSNEASGSMIPASRLLPLFVYLFTVLRCEKRPSSISRVKFGGNLTVSSSRRIRISRFMESTIAGRKISNP